MQCGKIALLPVTIRRTFCHSLPIRKEKEGILTLEKAHWKDCLQRERVQHNWRQSDLAEQLNISVGTIQRWEKGSQKPGPYYRLKLAALFGKSPEDLGFGVPSPSQPTAPQKETRPEEATRAVSMHTDLALWNIPHRRNPHFTGREELLAQLWQQLRPPTQEEPKTTRWAALTQAIKGLGGIGKTQIAVEYAYQAREQGRYTHILWVNAANEEALFTSFMALAELLPNFAARGETDQHKLIAAVKRWMEDCPQPWLLIADNADELSLVQSILPQQGLGSLLLTTRAHAVSALTASLEVETMGLVEGTQFLLQRTQRSSASEEAFDEAMNIVIALDGFPLALDQAGAYIEETGCSFADYLQLYQTHRLALLARRGQQTCNYPHSVATTWSLSFQKIEQANPAAAELLRLCAFLAPDRLPEELIVEGAVYWPPMLQRAATDGLAFNRLVEALLAFSLVKRRAEDHLLSIHRLVQTVQKETMELEEQRQWAERVVRAINAVFPSDPQYDAASWPHCLRYLEQVQACDQLIRQYQIQLPEAADLLDRAGLYLTEHASYTVARPLGEWALTLREQQFGPEHPLVASSLYHLAEIARHQNQYEQAEVWYHQALQIREKSGSEPFQVAEVLNGLAILAFTRNKYQEAESLYRRALQMGEQARETKYTPLAETLNGLARVYSVQGQYEQAKPLYQQALHIWKQTHGPDHPQVARILGNLGVLFAEQGKYEQAQVSFEQALVTLQQIPGQFIQMAATLSNLGELAMLQGHAEEARPLFQRALQILEEQFVSEQPMVALILNNLAELALSQGQSEEAKPLFQRALRLLEQRLGPKHYRVAEVLASLANLHRVQTNYAEAEQCFRRALAIRDETFGPAHIQNAKTLRDFASLQEAQGNHQEAATLYQRALAICEQTHGPQHAQTVEMRQRLQAVRSPGEQAEKITPLDVRREHEGKEKPATRQEVSIIPGER